MTLLPRDLREFVESLSASSAEFVIVGAHALAFHGHPRYTGDIDVLVHPTRDNAQRVIHAIERFGFGSLSLTEEDFVEEDTVVQLGFPPSRIDLLTAISGVSWEEVWAGKVEGDLDGLRVYFIGREHFIRTSWLAEGQETFAMRRSWNRVDGEQRFRAKCQGWGVFRRTQAADWHPTGPCRQEKT